MMDDATLLRRYAQNRSESDFAELVRRHLNLVYSAALRQVNGDRHLAQDVTQVVFTDLARKAGQLSRHRVLAGWLFTSTRFAAAKTVRGERRRQNREQEAQLMQEISSPDSSPQLDWAQVQPVLDEALGELSERDREAILLRYLEGHDFAQVGLRLSLSDNAARMRVDRAVDKLRALLARRGVTSSAGALALALTNQAVAAAPAGLAATVTGTALAGLAAGGGAAATLTFMSMTKLQLGLAAAVLVAGTGAFVVQAQNNAALRDELSELRQSGAGLSGLQQANQQLERAAGEAAGLRVSEVELARLRDEAIAVQDRLQASGATRTSRPDTSVARGPETYQPRQLDHMPKPTALVPPAYPPEMAKAGISGKVTVSMLIDSGGQVREALAVDSSRSEFEAAALAAVRQWLFEPGRKGGRLVNTWVTQVLEFNPGQGAGPAGPPTPAMDRKLPAPANWF